MNGVSEPEQLKYGVEAFHGIDKDMDGWCFLYYINIHKKIFNNVMH